MTEAPSPVARVVLQQCIDARLQLNYEETSKNSAPIDPIFASIGRGVVVYVCFFKGATEETVEKLAKLVLGAQLCEDDSAKRVSILDLPGDALVVPQATLGGRLKGKRMQYHGNIAKDEGLRLYDIFVARLSAEISRREKKVESGTYGNRQVLRLDTEGPYTHTLEV